MTYKTVNKDDYVAVQAEPMRCVDERGDKEGENLGVQMPGGAEHLMDLLYVAGAKTGKEIADERLFEMVEEVLASEAAKAHKLVAGVHIDDEHGHLDMDECETRNAGCGYDRVRAEVLKRMGVEVEYESGLRIEMARERGWGVQVLTGNHVAHATAAMNWMTDKTLKTQALWEEGRAPSFNHDIWAVKVLVGEMQRVLEAEGMSEAAELLGDRALDWSRQLYAETLDILSGGVLGDASILEIG